MYSRELILRSSTGCVRDEYGPLLYLSELIFPGDHLAWSEGRTDILPCALLGATRRTQSTCKFIVFTKLQFLISVSFSMQGAPA